MPAPDPALDRFPSPDLNLTLNLTLILFLRHLRAKVSSIYISLATIAYGEEIFSMWTNPYWLQTHKRDFTCVLL